MSGRPTVGERLAAAAVVGRALGIRIPGRHPVAWRDVDLSGRAGVDAPVRGRLWVPAGAPAPAVLLAAGITPQGPADPRVMRLADALARAGRVVFVPELALSSHRLERADVESLVGAVVALDDDPRTRGTTAALGFSFGGSYALVAAADERAASRLGLVAAFGAYADLVSLLDVLREGEPGRRERVRAAVRSYASHEVTDEDRDTLERVLVGDGSVDDLPAVAVRLLGDLSPARVADRVVAPVALVHAVGDTVIPHAELGRLQMAFPAAWSATVRLFTHVDFRPTPATARRVVTDVAAVWGLASRVLAAARTPLG
ncbi:MAG: hypothetical protein ACRDUY_04310 [Nitriliruptorales bacterium]